jgi:hypothetical protein
MTKFRRTASQPYSLITPSTCLADLELFLRNNIFALGTYLSSLTVPPFNCNLFLVTDYDRKFVLAVATSQDLEVSRILCFSVCIPLMKYSTELCLPSRILIYFIHCIISFNLRFPSSPSQPGSPRPPLV